MSNSQKRNLVLGMLLVIAFMFVGCSSHAPSASKFMNVKPHSFSMGIGGGFVAGDYYDERIDRNDDGHDSFTEVPALIEGVAFGREEHFLLGVSLETSLLPRFTAGFVSDYFGLQSWIVPFVFGEDFFKSKRPFGVMLIEQYPIQPGLNVGVSQFFANNSYAHIDSPDCCSLSFDYYANYYKELGAGVYITYKAVSFEFRYGKELESDNNRFYFDVNLMFDVISPQKKKNAQK